MRAPELRAELLTLAAEDARVRSELAAAGELFAGYHPRIEAVHRANAARLGAILETHGWPSAELVGTDGSDAAWLIAQHAIGEPGLQRRALAELERAVARGRAPAWQAAYLEDRIRWLEGRLQRYGTQMDWREDGELGPVPEIEEPGGVDARRTALGLEPLWQAVRRQRDEVRRSGERPPADLPARRRTMEEWARRAGWRG